MNNLNSKCEYCNKKLRPFRTKNDWNLRKLHKKCWKLQETQKMLNSFRKKDEERLRNNKIFYSKRVYIENCLISDDED